MASEDVQTNLRLPADLKDRLQASATENNRSLSAEVTSRLTSSFDGLSISGDIAAHFTRESQRMAESIESLKGLLRRTQQMFGLFMGYFREKGISLTSSEQEDFVALHREIVVATKEPDIDDLFSELEAWRHKIIELEERLVHLGTDLSPGQQAKANALRARIEAMKKEYLS